MAIDDNASYELTGYQVKDLASKIRAKADSNSLASVATSGLYSDLTGAPTIPTVYNGTLTIQQNGTTLGTFSANQDTNETINITGGGGTTYTAGNGINIDGNNEISIDDTVVAEVSDLPTDFTGATSSVAGSSGLVPAPTTSDPDKFLKGDGTWGTPASNSEVTTFYWDGSIGQNMQLYSDKARTTAVTVQEFEAVLYSQDRVMEVYDTDADYDYMVVASGPGWARITNGSWLYSITPVQNTNFNIELDMQLQPLLSDFTGATAITAGLSGKVPAPAAGDQNKALHGDGTWKDTTAKLVEMSYGESNAWAKFIAAYNAGSIVYCRASSNANPATGSQTRKALMAYVNNATNPTNVEFQYVRSQSSKSDSQQFDQVFVYKLTNASGGTWTVESRNMGPKIVAGTGMSSTFTTGANATITLNAEPDYSTSEVDTKVKWVDGKTIYRKTIHTGTLPNSGNIQVAHGISYSGIVKVEGIAQGNSSLSYTSFSLPFSGSVVNPASFIQIWVDATNITISTGSDRSGYDSYVTLYYTKSS